MLMSWLAVLGGFVLLVWSAERFVHGAAGLAGNLGVSPLIIGMTIMGFGTSAPEMLVSGMAASNGNPAIGVGNALGSNIANIALVLGATALIMPLSVDSRILRREYPMLFAVTLLAGALMLDGDGCQVGVGRQARRHAGRGGGGDRRRSRWGPGALPRRLPLLFQDRAGDIGGGLDREPGATHGRRSICRIHDRSSPPATGYKTCLPTPCRAPAR